MLSYRQLITEDNLERAQEWLLTQCRTVLQTPVAKKALTLIQRYPVVSIACLGFTAMSVGIITISMVIAIWPSPKPQLITQHYTNQHYSENFEYPMIDETMGQLAKASDTKVVDDWATSPTAEDLVMMGVEAAQALPGRLDPFEPLITDGEAYQPEKEKDALDGVQYSGYIAGDGPNANVAIFKVAQDGVLKTVVKKSGESFYANNARIVVTGVNTGSVKLNANGAKRLLTLDPYVELSKNSSNQLSTAGTALSGTTGAVGAAGGDGKMQLQDM